MLGFKLKLWMVSRDFSLMLIFWKCFFLFCRWLIIVIILLICNLKLWVCLIVRMLFFLVVMMFFMMIVWFLDLIGFLIICWVLCDLVFLWMMNFCNVCFWVVVSVIVVFVIGLVLIVILLMVLGNVLFIELSMFVVICKVFLEWSVSLW